ncbi:MAG: hypothetical protein JWO05_1076 [Gemmatimonadetes bacterium]|nr:hypothetical protein [Gemmatimonadota bacterium]
MKDLVAVSLAALLLGSTAPHARTNALPDIASHDNDHPAGRIVSGTLELQLEIRKGMFRPNGPTHAGTPMYTFAERGKPATIPSPLLRMPLGTRVHASVTNSADTTIVVHGLADAAHAGDSLVLAPGAQRDVRFVADRAGDHLYYGMLPGHTLATRRQMDAHFAGVFIVDAPGAKPVNEHVLLISLSSHSMDSTGALTQDLEMYVINGRPWPHTQRLTGAVGDSMHFRVFNASNDPHPMHLHGTYFRVLAYGDARQDTSFTPEKQRAVVTQLMLPGTTMRMAWMPERPGTWLFHCHLTFHTTPNIGFDSADSTAFEVMQQGELNGAHMHDPDTHVETGMGGLMMAITVPPPRGWKLPTAVATRSLRLAIPDDSTSADTIRYFAPSVTEGSVTTPALRRAGPGAPIVLHVGEPVRIRVLNGSSEATSIHWHGIELESLYDGVVGLGGTPGANTHAIKPHDSLDVRFTAPRAGTFIYHTHFMELRQGGGGLFGPLIVLPPGESWDAKHDHVLMITNVSDIGLGVNGTRKPEPMEVEAGTPQRLRLINITPGNPLATVGLEGADSLPVKWTIVAKDGMAWPLAQQRTVSQRMTVSMGETYDVVFTPEAGRDLRLCVRRGTGRLAATQVIHVR